MTYKTKKYCSNCEKDTIHKCISIGSKGFIDKIEEIIITTNTEFCISNDSEYLIECTDCGNIEII